MAQVLFTLVFSLFLPMGGMHLNGITQASKLTPTTSHFPKWQVPTYKGLTLGKSTRADVARLFGKPQWSGHPEDEYDNPVASLLSYEYENVGGFRGRIAIIMKRRSGVVVEVLLHPADEQALTVKQVIDEYGNGYVERGPDLGICPTEKESRYNKSPKEKQYPYFLVYPRRGMFITINSDQRVQEIAYILRCP